MELTIVKSTNAVTSLNINNLGDFNVNVYPNPVKASPLTVEVSIRIVDLAGKPLLNKVYDVSAGNYNKLIIEEVATYPTGSYILVLTSKMGFTEPSLSCNNSN